MSRGHHMVAHLTRMSADRVCLATIELDTGRIVRPVLKQGYWTRSDTVRGGGDLALGRIVEFERVHGYPPVPPFCEDVAVSPSYTVVGRLSDEEFWRLLRGHVQSNLGDVFGPVLQKVWSDKAAVTPFDGHASLGFVAEPGDLIQIGRSELRFQFFDPMLGELKPPVTDLRLWGHDGTTIRPLCSQVARRLAAGKRPILAVGLARPWGNPQRCWMQVNNIHFEDSIDDHPALQAALR